MSKYTEIHWKAEGNFLHTKTDSQVVELKIPATSGILKKNRKQNKYKSE